MSAIFSEAAPRVESVEFDRLMERLAAADRSLQQEEGTLVVLRSWRWLVPWLFGALVADVLFHLSAPARLGLLPGFVALILGRLVYAIWVGCFRRSPAAKTARVLEPRHPRLGSKLIHVLQLRAQTTDPQLAPLTRELAGDAITNSVADLATFDFQALTATKRPALEGKRLGIALIASLAILGFGHDIVRTEVPRFVDPFGDHPPYSFTRVSITEPAVDGVPVFYGRNLMITAQTHGYRPSDLFMTFHPPGQPEKAVTVPMFDKGTQGFAQQIESVKTDLIVVAHSRNRHSLSTQRFVSVVLTPRLEKATMKIMWPVHTGLPPEERAMPMGKSVKVLAESRIEVRLESNRPLRGGRVDLVKGPGEVESIALSPMAERAVSGGFEVAEPGVLKFSLMDEAGNPSSEPAECSLQVVHDLPPELQVSNPSADAFVAMDFKIEPAFEASDDYGVRTLRIHQAINGKYGQPRIVEYERVTRNARETQPLDLATMGLKSGDKVSFFAEAIDTAPDTHMERSQTVTLTVISVKEYNDFLRERTDMDDIAAKYSDSLKKLQDLIEEQKQLGERAAALKKELETAADKTAAQQKLDALLAKQNELNAQLNKLAGAMEEFVRAEPLYDIEKELGDTLKKQAGQIRESTKSNDEAAKDIAQRSAPLNAPREVDSPMMDDFQKASDEQLAKLGAAEKKAQEDVVQPLEDMALMNAILQDINRFKELDAAQKQVAGQARAYDRKAPLNREDQLALKNLAAMEKRIGGEIEAVQKQLTEDGRAAMEKFPKAGQSAQNLAEKMEDLRLSSHASAAMEAMLAGRGGQGAQLAQKLSEEMAKMFSECNGNCPNMSGELDQYLKIQRGMKPGNNFKQMMQSRKFGSGGKPGFAMGQGQTGQDGTGGYAMEAAPETPVLGNEARPNDRRSRRAGDKGMNRQAPGMNKSGAAVNESDVLQETKSATRDSEATPGESSFEQYHELVERYFKSITK